MVDVGVDVVVDVVVTPKKPMSKQESIECLRSIGLECRVVRGGYEISGNRVSDREFLGLLNVIGPILNKVQNTLKEKTP